MKGKIAGIILIVMGIAALCVLSYQLGASQKEVKIVTQKVEVIKYVEKKKAGIYSKPNASKSELLKRMRAGVL